MEAWINSLPPIIGLPIGIVYVAFILVGAGLLYAWTQHFVLSVIVTVVLFIYWRSRRDKIRELY